MRLSTLDRKILNLIQEEILPSSQLFKTMAEKIGITEEKLLAKIREFKEKGIIRAYSARLNHRKLGFESTLIALRVGDNDIDSMADYLTQQREVTHCYLRQGQFNLWFVFLYKDGQLREVLNKISKQIGRKNILNLKTIKKFKLQTRLKI